jgi:hypothetical protein
LSDSFVLYGEGVPDQPGVFDRICPDSLVSVTGGVFWCFVPIYAKKAASLAEKGRKPFPLVDPSRNGGQEFLFIKFSACRMFVNH